jgi:hypothetical protein
MSHDQTLLYLDRLRLHTKVEEELAASSRADAGWLKFPHGTHFGALVATFSVRPAVMIET